MNMHGRIKQLRENKGLTQDEVSKLLGIPRPTYAKWEDSIEPKYEGLVRLAKHYGVTTDWILYGAESDKNILPGSEVLILTDDGSGGHKLVDISKLPPDEQKVILNIIETYKQKHIK